MTRTTSILLAVFLGAIPCFAGESAFSSRPDIVCILVDDLGWGDLSCQGAKDLQTPNIDSLAASGMRFDRAYANCPVCSPTRASLLTGCYPELVGVPGVIRTHPEDSWGWLSPSAVLLPRLLKKAGYHTAIIGKWHLGLERPDSPNARGFDHFAGFLGDMMDDYFTHRRHGINYMRLEDKEIDPKGHATDLFTDWAVRYIRGRAREKAPFFLYLPYNAPHAPIQPPPAWLAKVKARQPGMDDRRARIVALIEHLDDGIGKVLAAVRESARSRNTLIIFTSDNGGKLSAGASNGPLRGGKQEMYEGGIRAPLCAVWPGRISPGSRSERIVLTMDIFPTVCEAAGARIEHSIDGLSFLPELLGRGGKAPERTLFWTRREGNNRYMGKTIWAVRRGPWKLLQNSPMGPFELYNLDADPMEAHDLSEKNRRIFNDLAGALRKHMQRGGAVPWQKPRD